DVLMLVGLLPQSLPQDGDVPGEPSLFYNRVTPKLLEQFVLRERALPILDEHKERLQDLWSQRHGFAFAQQASLGDIQEKGPELVRSSQLLTHFAGRNNSEEKRRSSQGIVNTRPASIPKVKPPLEWRQVYHKLATQPEDRKA